MSARSAEWRVEIQPVEDPSPIPRAHPLASKGGMQALANILNADNIWRALTKRQRELLLSTAAGAPVAARADVRRRLEARGLLHADNGSRPRLTEAGRLVILWRLP